MRVNEASVMLLMLGSCTGRKRLVGKAAEVGRLPKDAWMLTPSGYQPYEVENWPLYNLCNKINLMGSLLGLSFN